MPLLLNTTFARAAGIDLLFVPHGSEAESRQDVVSGLVSTPVFWAPVALQLTRAGKVRPLAHAGAVRHPDLPDVATFAFRQHRLVLVTPLGHPLALRSQQRSAACA